MLTTSEIAASITVWGLTAIGVFFGSRAVWRRRKKQHKPGQEPRGKGGCHD